MSEAPLRVAWVAGEPTPYRVPQLRVLAAQADIDLTVIYAARTFQHRTWTVEHPGAIFLRGPSLPTARVLHHDYPITPGIWSLLRRGRFDLVVVAGWAVFAAQAAILWCRLHGVPYVLISENHLRENRPAWVRLLKGSVLPHVVPHAAGTLVTGVLAREHILSYGARPDGVIVFPNTVDVDKLSRQADELRPKRDSIRQQLGFGDRELVVLQVARLIPTKGPDLLVNALARARQEHRLNLRLVLAGNGPLGSDLKALAERSGIPLTMTGHVEDEALTSLYVAADVFALFSRREPWGVVVNEAMACGLPLLLSRAVGAAADLLVDNSNGFAVDPHDEIAAARALAILGDAGVRHSFGSSSREIIASWGYEQSVDAFRNLAHSVISRERARQAG